MNLIDDVYYYYMLMLSLVVCLTHNIFLTVCLTRNNFLAVTCNIVEFILLFYMCIHAHVYINQTHEGCVRGVFFAVSFIRNIIYKSGNA